MIEFSDKSLGGSARRYLAPFRRHFDNLLTSVFVSKTLDGVTSFFLSQQRKKCMSTSALHSKLLAGFLYSMAESWKNLKDTITFSSSSMCLTRNRSALVRDLFSNKSKFAGQL